MALQKPGDTTILARVLTRLSNVAIRPRLIGFAIAQKTEGAQRSTTSGRPIQKSELMHRLNHALHLDYGLHDVCLVRNASVHRFLDIVEGELIRHDAAHIDFP